MNSFVRTRWRSLSVLVVVSFCACVLWDCFLQSSRVALQATIVANVIYLAIFIVLAFFAGQVAMRGSKVLHERVGLPDFIALAIAALGALILMFLALAFIKVNVNARFGLTYAWPVFGALVISALTLMPIAIYLVQCWGNAIQTAFRN